MIKICLEDLFNIRNNWPLKLFGCQEYFYSAQSFYVRNTLSLCTVSPGPLPNWTGRRLCTARAPPGASGAWLPGPTLVGADAPGHSGHGHSSAPGPMPGLAGTGSTRKEGGIETQIQGNGRGLNFRWGGARKSGGVTMKTQPIIMVNSPWLLPQSA